MIPSIVFSILFIVLAIILLMGKGDKLIAGNNKTSQLAAAGIFIAITIVGIIVANTWAKKK
ncbi:MAG: hypothetical protein K6F74_08290 [Prevotella sp.]|nr:hypothetical protein [Prevotella sp.]